MSLPPHNAPQLPHAVGPTAQSLDGLWSVRAVGDLSGVPENVRGRTIPATVPGCIHTDLMDAGLIPDLARNDCEAAIQWVSLANWRYELEFHADPALFAHHELDLVFDCLDTIGTVELNGDKVGDAASEFIPHRFSVLGLLRPGTNRLAVTFKSPLRHIREEAARLGPRPVNGDWDPYVFIRKCASNFGWDWGPKVATCGITEGVRLEGWSVVRLAQVRLLSGDATIHCAAVKVCAGLVWSGATFGRRARLKAVLSTPEGQTRRSTVDCDFGVPQVEFAIKCDGIDRWYPHDRGRPALHTVAVDLCHATGDTDTPALLQWTGRWGLRSTCTDSEFEAVPVDFPLLVNGKTMLCKGANWIPEGLWPRDRTPERVRERLQQLVDANMNMIRVWGGGRYEPDWFYDLCDEMGIMVWQDFMFSCACYPEEEPVRSLVEAEARHQVARLARHPSIVLWCGGNECIWAHENWGFKEKLALGHTWGEHYYLELLPKVLAELDRTRPYWPNSPWSPRLPWSDADSQAPAVSPSGSSFSMGRSPLPPNGHSTGDRHTWDVDLLTDRSIVPRFCSEFGQQSPPNLATLTEALGAGALRLDAPWLEDRQRGPGGNTRWYDEPLKRMGVDVAALKAQATRGESAEAFALWHATAQRLQALALRTHIEWLRINWPACSGILLWQLNDAWAGPSWSIIDSAGRPKPAYEAVKSAFSPRLLSIQPVGESGGLVLFACNDTDELWSDIALIEPSARRLKVVVKPRSVERVGPVGAPGDLLLVACGDLTAQWPVV